MSKLADASRPATIEMRTSPESGSTIGRVDSVCEAIQLVDLPGQPLAFALDLVALLARALQRSRRILPARMQQPDARRVDTGLRIEQGARVAGAREALPRVLTVDLHQMVGRLAQLAHGGRAAVDPRATLAL